MLSTNRTTINLSEQNSDNKISNNNETMVFFGTLYCKINVTYWIGKNKCDIHLGNSLVEIGANGGVFGSDVRVIERQIKQLL